MNDHQFSERKEETSRSILYLSTLQLLWCEWTMYDNEGGISRSLKESSSLFNYLHEYFIYQGETVLFFIKIDWKNLTHKVKLETLVEGDPKAPFSIATTPRCREGRYSFPWIAPLYSYLIMLSVMQGAIKYHFFNLWYDDLGLSISLSGNTRTLYQLGQWAGFDVKNATNLLKTLLRLLCQSLFLLILSHKTNDPLPLKHTHTQTQPHTHTHTYTLTHLFTQPIRHG